MTAKDFELTPSLHTYITERFSKLEHFRDDLIDANVSLTIERHHTKGDKYLADARIRIPGKDVYAFVRDVDMRKAVDVLVAKLGRQLRKGKERRLMERHKVRG